MSNTVILYNILRFCNIFNTQLYIQVSILVGKHCNYLLQLDISAKYTCFTTLNLLNYMRTPFSNLFYHGPVQDWFNRSFGSPKYSCSNQRLPTVTGLSTNWSFLCGSLLVVWSGPVGGLLAVHATGPSTSIYMSTFTLLASWKPHFDPVSTLPCSFSQH